MNPTLLPLGLVWLLATRTAALDPASLRERLPKCSLLCLADGVTRHNCSLADVECQCDNIEPIIKTVAPCLVQAGCDLQNITGGFFSFFLSWPSLLGLLLLLRKNKGSRGYRAD